MVKNIAKNIVKGVLSKILKLKFRALKKYDFEPANIKTIGLVCLKPMGIGDLIMDTASFREIRAKFPKAKITLFTFIDILKRNSSIDKIITSKKELKDHYNKIDLVILPNKNLLQSFTGMKLSRKYVLGYFYDWNVVSNITDFKNYEFDIKEDHFYDMGYKAIKNLDLKEKSNEIDKINFENKHLDKVKRLINYTKNDLVLSINPAAIWESKTWDKNNYRFVIEKLIDKCKIVVVGGPGDIEYNDYFDDLFQKHNNFYNFTGKTNLFELAALFSLSKLLITGDTGPMHVALSQKIDVVSIWGVTNPFKLLPKSDLDKNNFLYPKGEKDFGIYNLEFPPKSNVINKIKPQKVLKRVEEILAK